MLVKWLLTLQCMIVNNSGWFNYVVKSQMALDGRCGSPLPSFLLTKNCNKSVDSLEARIKEFGSCSSSGFESNLKSPISTLFGNKSSRCYTESSSDNEDCLVDWEAVADALAVTEKQPSPYVEPVESQIVFNFQGAWHPNDALRPQCLPNPVLCHVPMISSTKSMNMGCPICFEDLDSTDSSFLPCPCGFHLCLFCHKRILEVDGRCPGCRKDYNP